MWIYISWEHWLIFIHQIWLFEILITTEYTQWEKHGFSSNMHTRLCFVLFWDFSCNYILKVYILLELTSLWISVLTHTVFWLLFLQLDSWISYTSLHPLEKISISEPQYSCYCPSYSFHLSFSPLQPWIFKYLWPIPVMLWVVSEFLEGRQNFVMDFPWYWHFTPSPMLLGCSNTDSECSILMIKQNCSSLCRATVII